MKTRIRPKNARNIMSPAQTLASMENMQLLEQERNNINKRANGINCTIEDALHNDLDPVRINKRETPAHRTMVNMAAAGYQVREIAAMTGYCHNTVATALKQPHARQYLVEQAKKTIQQEVRELLESEVLPSLHVVKAIRDNPEARSADRLAASNTLLDRFLGKPVQPINEEMKPPSEMSDDELRRQVERELTGGSN